MNNNLEKKEQFKFNDNLGLWCELAEDGKYYPTTKDVDLEVEPLDENYAKLREEFLKEEKPKLYAQLVKNGELEKHCAEIESKTKEEVEILFDRLMVKSGYDENFKLENPKEYAKKEMYFKSLVREKFLCDIVRK